MSSVFFVTSSYTHRIEIGHFLLKQSASTTIARSSNYSLVETVTSSTAGTTSTSRRQSKVSTTSYPSTQNLHKSTLHDSTTADKQTTTSTPIDGSTTAMPVETFTTSTSATSPPSTIQQSQVTSHSATLKSLPTTTTPIASTTIEKQTTPGTTIAAAKTETTPTAKQTKTTTTVPNTKHVTLTSVPEERVTAPDHLSTEDGMPITELTEHTLLTEVDFVVFGVSVFTVSHTNTYFQLTAVHHFLFF